MKAFLISLSLMVVIAGASAVVLNSLERSSKDVYSSSYTRF